MTADDNLPSNASTRLTAPDPAAPPTDTQALAPDLDVPTQVQPAAPQPAPRGGAQVAMRAPEGPGEIGRLGPYRVLELLGAGGMGCVYRAEDVQLQRPVALKILKPQLAHEEDLRKRFLREARAAAQCKNDHIVTIYQVGEDQGTPYLAMEYLDGEGLDHWL